jgi:hypothetical protein
MYFSFKLTTELLKRNPILAKINQHFKSYLLKRNYFVIVRNYKNIELHSRRYKLPKLTESVINILFLGSDYTRNRFLG